MYSLKDLITATKINKINFRLFVRLHLKRIKEVNRILTYNSGLNQAICFRTTPRI